MRHLMLMLAVVGLTGCPRGQPVTPPSEARESHPPEASTQQKRPVDGPVVKYWDAGKKQKRYAGRHLGGVRHGTWTWWFSTGQKSMVATYVRGRYHGPARRWYPNGRLRLKGEYQNDQKVGTWTEYSADGSKVKTCDYRAGAATRCKTTFDFQPDTIDSNCLPIPRARPRRKSRAQP